MFSEWMRGLKVFLLLTFLTGIVYPWVVTISGELWFEKEINGSLAKKNGETVGSELIGQKYESPIYFHGRPSAADYSTVPSGASNLGPTSSLLIQQVQERKEKFLAENELSGETQIPVEMVFASGSGLDPHISVKSAELQINRIAKARQYSEVQKSKLSELVNQLAEKPQFSFFGEERINVLLLNLEVDQLK
jgi:K+-transporting ATPase ATPase C chain